jgi:hypothetical protein
VAISTFGLSFVFFVPISPIFSQVSSFFFLPSSWLFYQPQMGELFGKLFNISLLTLLELTNIQRKI